MNSKKLLISILLLLNLSTNISNSLENRIILKIDRDIVTIVDIKEETKYLSDLKYKKIFSYNSKANKNFLTPKQLTNLINKNKGDFEN